MDIDKIILNFIWKFIDLRISVTELKSNKKSEQITLPVNVASYIATIIKRLWYWQRDRYIGGKNKIENPEIDPHK